MLIIIIFILLIFIYFIYKGKKNINHTKNKNLNFYSEIEEKDNNYKSSINNFENNDVYDYDDNDNDDDNNDSYISYNKYYENFENFKKTLNLINSKEFNDELIRIDVFRFLNYFQDRVFYEKTVPDWLNIKRKNLFDICINDGYITEDDITTEDILNNLTVIELKKILKDNNFKVSGNKKDLVLRILDNKLFTPKIDNQKKYYISEKGKNHLKNYDFVCLLSPYNEIWGYKMYALFANSFKKNFSKRDVLWGLLNQYILYEVEPEDEIYLHMFQFLSQENNVKRTLVFAFVYIYMRINIYICINHINKVYIDHSALKFINENKEIYFKEKNSILEELKKIIGNNNSMSIQNFEKIINELLNNFDYITFTDNYSFIKKY